MLSQGDRFELMAMHEYRRPHLAAAEEKFIKRFIKPLGVKRDGFGNYYKIIGDDPSVLWSCHTDTVHTIGGKQRLAHWGGTLRLAWGELSNCLGADDTAGVWMLMQMIRREIPGLYIFHRGEEVGCLGSHYFAKHNWKLVQGCDMAIAFDRRGTSDIVDHQLGRRCASKTFTESLSAGLNMGHKAAYGSYTDTATYMLMVSEVTNISVGYEGAHWKTEKLDMNHLAQLRDAVFSLKVDDLIIERDPTAVEPEPWYKREWKNITEDAEPFGVGPNAHVDAQPDTMRERYKHGNGHAFNGHTYDPDQGDWVREKSRLITLADFARAFPDETADYMESLGVNAVDLRDYLDNAAGGMRLDRLFKENGNGHDIGAK